MPEWIDRDTITASTSNTWRTNSPTLNWDNLTINSTPFRMPEVRWDGPVTDSALECRLNEFAEALAHKIYKIITQHVQLDITEDELVDILKENK